MRVDAVCPIFCCMTGTVTDLAVASYLAKYAFALGKSDVLCRTPRGTLLRRDYYNREIWKPAVAAAGLPADTTFHDLRHAFASTALAEGVPISEVSRWLGHKSITATVDLYGHLVPEAADRARCAGQGVPAGHRSCALNVPWPIYGDATSQVSAI